MIRDFTGLLLIFIGLIIGLFTGYGFIVALIGLFMLAGQNENFRRARNFFIGTVIMTIAGSILINSMIGTVVLALRSGRTGSILMSIIGFMLGTVAVLIALFIININAFKSILEGCRDVAESKMNTVLAEACTRTYYGYRNSLIASTICTCATVLFFWVPILNVILMVAAVCMGIWYFVYQIMIIIRVWQTYALRER